MDPKSIAHARVEAQRLLKRTKTPDFVVPQNLSAALDVVATLKGYPHWHALSASSTHAASSSARAPSLFAGSAAPGEHEVLEQPGLHVLFAKPGLGKSVWSHQHILHRCLPSLDNLPRTHVIDVGPASEGTVELLRAQLPPARGQRLVVHHRLDKKGSSVRINPLDLPLGLRSPIGRDREAKAVWITAWLNLSNSKFPNHVRIDSAQLPLVVKQGLMFAYQDAVQHPRLYEVGVDPLIDRWFHHRTRHVNTWWGLVDFFITQGLFLLARRAQRQAVPTFDRVLAHIAVYAYSTRSLDELAASMSASCEELGIAWQNGRTNVDWEEARVVVLDLDHVLIGGGIGDFNYLSAQVALGMQSGLVDSDDLDHVPLVLSEQGMPMNVAEALVAWHRDERAKTPTTWTLYDEYHRASGHHPLGDSSQRAFIGLVVKSSDRMALFSTQNDQDLTTLIVAMKLARSSSLWLMAFNPREAAVLQKKLGWSDAQLQAFEQANLGRFYVTDAKIVRVIDHAGRWESQLVDRVRPTPFVLAALSTTGEDRHVRQMLVQRLGWEPAVRLLAERFPHGVKQEVERRAEEGDDRLHLLDGIVDELWEAAP